MNYKGSSTFNSNSDTSPAEELNCFFARFEEKTFISPSPLPGLDIQPLVVQKNVVRQLFRTVNPRKATGPDGVHGMVLRACAYQQLLFSQTSSIGLLDYYPCCK